MKSWRNDINEDNLESFSPGGRDLDTFELIDFVLDPDGDEGIHAEVRRLSDKKIFILALDYLKVKPRKSKNFSLVDDYGVWFVNYR